MIFELDKKVLLYWRFTAAVLFAAVFSALWIAVPDRYTVKILSSLVLLAVATAYCFVYLPLRFKAESVSISGGRIICRKGVIIKRKYIYPNARLVYVQTVRLPLASCFGLYVTVLRGVGHSLILPALTLKQQTEFLKAVREDE